VTSSARAGSLLPCSILVLPEQSLGDVKMELKPGQDGLGGVDVRMEDTLKTLQTRQSLLRNVGKTIFMRRKPAAV
jgi:hypothetical protein